MWSKSLSLILLPVDEAADPKELTPLVADVIEIVLAALEPIVSPLLFANGRNEF